MSFGDVIRSAASISTNPLGIGGSYNTIYAADITDNRIRELNVSDFSNIRSALEPWNHAYGIGGNENIIWFCDAGTKRLAKLNLSDFSVDWYIQASVYINIPDGIGGNENVVWCCSQSTNRTFELSTSDLSIIRMAGTSSDNPSGIGGDETKIWMSEIEGDRIYEVAVSDLSEILFVSSPGTHPVGIGGDTSTIWHCDNIEDKIYELDAVVTYTISGNVQNSNGLNLPSVAISLEDDTDYFTVSDVNGDYSQVVNPDVYDVVASIPGNTDQSASVDASSSDQTQDFIFPMTTAPHDKAIRLIERHLLE